MNMVTFLPVIFLASSTTLLLLLLRIFPTFFFNNRSKTCLPPSPLGLPVVGQLHLLGPLVHQSFHNLSIRYGPLIHLRLGSIPCVVVASSSELAKEFLKTHELTFSSRKQSAAITHLTYDASFAFAPIGPYWKFMKKLCMSELLGGRRLDRLCPLRRQELLRFVEFLMNKARVGETVNLTKEILRLTNNVISGMMLGIRYSAGMESQSEEIRNLIREVTRIFGELNLSDHIWFLKKVDLWGFRKRCEEIHRMYDVLLEKIINEREDDRKKKKKKGHACDDHDGDADYNVRDLPDVFFDVLENQNAEMRLARENIKALVLDILTAGTDTTAISIEWALAELVNHTPLLDKARKEIDTVVRKNRLVEESDIPYLPYTQAIVKEALRLHPPIPMVARKSTRNCKIRCYDIPADTLFFFNVWSIGRDPKYWESPLEFRPERFIACGDDHQSSSSRSNSVADVKGQDFHLLPFGTRAFRLFPFGCSIS